MQTSSLKNASTPVAAHKAARNCIHGGKYEDRKKCGHNYSKVPNSFFCEDKLRAQEKSCAKPRFLSNPHAILAVSPG
jgi:hypothetical protein